MSKNPKQWSDSQKISALLQLKRHEKPAPEFWHKFEREMEEKRLQALVKPSWSSWMGKVVTEHRAWIAPVTALPLLIVSAAYLFYFSSEEGPQSIAGISSDTEDQHESASGTMAKDPLTGEPMDIFSGDFSVGDFPAEIAVQGTISFVADNLAKAVPNEEVKGFRTELTQDVLEKDLSDGPNQIALVSFSREGSEEYSSSRNQMSF